MNEDRILECLLGLVVGDALSTAIELQARDSSPPVTDMVGEGVFDLAPGQRTDDMSVTLCIIASLTETGTYDLHDQLVRFIRWYRDGYLSSMGRYFDTGNQTRAAPGELGATGEPYHEPAGRMSADNGSSMRLALVATAFYDDPEAAGRFSTDSSCTTHPAVECVEVCGAYGRLIAAAIEGVSCTELYVLTTSLVEQTTSPELATILRGFYWVKEHDEILSSGYILHDLKAALWALASTDDFLEEVLLAADLDDDTDAVGTTYGQLVGTLYGRNGIPKNWRDHLHDTEMIENLAAGIVDRVGTFEVVIG